MRKVQNVDDDKYWTINRKKYRIAPKKCKPIQTCKIYNYAKGEPGLYNFKMSQSSFFFCLDASQGRQKCTHKESYYIGSQGQR